MGLSHSKPHPRVIKVAPLQNKEEETPSAGPAEFAFTQNLEEKRTYSLARRQDRSKAWEGQLPPLRETWYGRYSAVPRAMYFDIPLEQGETSIIKRHPPRRLQKLEPIDLPQVITSERILSQREPRTTHKAKELEKKMPIPMYTSGKRQYLHKMQMLEINRKRQEAQVELKKSLHREARINKEKPRDSTAKKILDSIPRDDDDFLAMLPDETLNPSPGNSQNAEFLEHHSRNDNGPQKIGKMETWLREQEARGQLLWDSSSSDSDELGKVTKKQRALVRTRTERIPPFDEFFDRE
ncbi:factor associated with metabolism and energy isoform X2 [Myotis yumanensis]|uniref:factor associated with metabolism and energy isoform X2 n=1 Tax=Myotis yumanensis TaxID=159337 RepID=UPI0038CF61FB